MKKVLIADKHTLFREFLTTKLEEDQIEVILTQENRDTYTKMITVLPNLIILDMEDDSQEEMEFLERKIENFNTINIPVVVTGPSQDKSNLAALAKYGVVKYFAKPIQFDIFFDSIGKILHTPLSIDTTPCVLDLHRNGNLIFIELAHGLNREKMVLLQYKLSEMIEREEIDNPKIVIMLTNLELSFIDGYNIEFLIDNVLACPKVHNKNVKILSLSPFVKELLSGHPQYADIEMANQLPRLLTSLVDTTITSSVSDLITDKILTQSNEFGDDSGTVDTRFSYEAGGSLDDGTVLNVAIIDADAKSAEQTKQIYESISANVTVYNSGKVFCDSYIQDKFNLVILDALMPDNSGIQVLQFLHQRSNTPDVIVYSANIQRDLIVKVLSLGAKHYLVKPQKPNVLIQKSLATIKGNM
ncbi:MAG: response regulator [Treponema sp.]|nr:response regulator [Treponema sp.]MDY4985399.1 response regulator [Treponema sp.]